jgi:serine/threonine-protein kinase HipA
MSRHSKVTFKNRPAGTLEETDEGLYRFTYDATYIAESGALPISFTLPIRTEPYEASVLFPFFDGLIPEGWLLDIAVENWKFQAKDRFGLLLLTGSDVIGAVSVTSESPIPSSRRVKATAGLNLKDFSSSEGLRSSPRCLVCLEPRDSTERHPLYHEKCRRSFFDSDRDIGPLDLDGQKLKELGEYFISRNAAVTGVQRKISLDLDFVETGENESKRVRLGGRLGNSAFILKPAHEKYPGMPELEFITMRFAALARIPVADCALVPVKQGGYAYVTKRFDRTKQGKVAVEDAAQYSEKATESKYKSTYEQLGKITRKYSSVPGDDALRIFEIVAFSFLTGNGDMHLKNFSLWRDPGKKGLVRLSPAYDLLPTSLLVPGDPEEFALHLNGKKNKIRATDFVEFAKALGLTELQTERARKRLAKTIPAWRKTLEECRFLEESLRESFSELIAERATRMDL